MVVMERMEEDSMEEWSRKRVVKGDSGVDGVRRGSGLTENGVN